VAVMLNVSADHLGMDGVHSVAELAEVKSVVARSARRAAVLNAEDAHCVAMRLRLGLGRGVEVIYFSMDHEAPVLLRHLAGGGRAVYLKDGRVTLASNGHQRPLLHVKAMPAALGGHAMHNVANAMAATAALVGAGHAPDLAVAALSSFVSDAASNPLRANLFKAGGVAILVDYAHNSAACASLVTMARSLCSGRLRAVITVPGDRRDGDLADIGRVCGAGFDELLVYEAEPRGRPPGDTAGHLLAGAREAGGGWMDAERDVRQALARMLARCQPGDMLVFTCGGSLEDLIAVLRPLDPVAADTMAMQVKWASACKGASLNQPGAASGRPSGAGLLALRTERHRAIHGFDMEQEPAGHQRNHFPPWKEVASHDLRGDMMQSSQHPGMLFAMAGQAREVTGFHQVFFLAEILLHLGDEAGIAVREVGIGHVGQPGQFVKQIAMCGVHCR
jgi:folylpolyglutamate synthase/dihydropteroate synthase